MFNVVSNEHNEKSAVNENNFQFSTIFCVVFGSFLISQFSSEWIEILINFLCCFVECAVEFCCRLHPSWSSMALLMYPILSQLSTATSAFISNLWHFAIDFLEWGRKGPEKMKPFEFLAIVKIIFSHPFSSIPFLVLISFNKFYEWDIFSRAVEQQKIRLSFHSVSSSTIFSGLLADKNSFLKCQNINLLQSRFHLSNHDSIHSSSTQKKETREKMCVQSLLRNNRLRWCWCSDAEFGVGKHNGVNEMEKKGEERKLPLELRAQHDKDAKIKI